MNVGVMVAVERNISPTDLLLFSLVDGPEDGVKIITEFYAGGETVRPIRDL